MYDLSSENFHLIHIWRWNKNLNKNNNQKGILWSEKQQKDAI